MKTKRATPKIAPSRLKTPKPKCGLCGKRTNLALTACCGNWICNDQHKYVLFSYARNSCQRNHDRYTLCSSHYHEKHKGDWQTCAKCKKSFETERMNTILKSWKTRQVTNRPNARNAAKLLRWAPTAI
jgi:hypothetical protein